jgi:oligopeptide transport system ATP-binding protein
MSHNPPLLAVRNLKVSFDIRRKGSLPWTRPRQLKAVDGVSFDLYPGETLGVVGESGCGKSTLARAVISMIPARHGSAVWMGQTDILSAEAAALREIRRDVQMIFQDPLASLNPRMTIREIIAEPLITHFPKTPKAEVTERVRRMMDRVGLLPNQINRYPHEFSGGQCQRIGIARALILEPRLIICDEPVSALDVSIQAQVINLLMELQQEMGLSLIFIAHDLSVVRHISTRIMVLYLGNVCEVSPSFELYDDPRHPYTRALISSVPIPDPEKERHKQTLLLEGDLPSPMNPPSGCVFRTRCPQAQPLCATQKPELGDSLSGHVVACHFPLGKKGSDG